MQGELPAPIPSTAWSSGLDFPRAAKQQLRHAGQSATQRREHFVQGVELELNGVYRTTQSLPCWAAGLGDGQRGKAVRWKGSPTPSFPNAPHTKEIPYVVLYYAC